MTTTDLVNRFSYHPPSGTQEWRYTEIRQRLLDLAVHIDEAAPDSREKSLAITHLEEAMFWTNAAIARNENPVPEEA